MPLSSPQTSLSKLLSGAQLPALPQSAVRLLEVSQDLNNGPAEFAVPIEADPGLTGQVLRFVNSSYFSFRKEISSIRFAITLVGVRTIKNFALWSAVFSLAPNPKCGAFNLKALWQDSLRRALFARALGLRLKLPEAEDLFAAALLQDMAVPLLAKQLPTEYAQLLATRADGQNRLSNLERELFGWDHAEAGGVMARGWKLPESLAALIGQHARPIDLAAHGVNGGLVVQLSSLLPTTCDADWQERDVFAASLQHVMHDGTSVESLFAQVDAEFIEIAPVLKLAQPSRLLGSYLTTSSFA